ncbi:ATP-binding protein [Ekhidna sp.]|uniref:sensor histidine kinase n=1 Tax=Ekhidna sp. TaxID=2608089 RepID=UPI003296A227
MEGKVILLIIIGTIGVMLMAFSVVFFVLLYRRKVLENQLKIQEIKNKHQQEMLNATLSSQETERSRLGTELHDSIGAMLSSIKLNLQVAKRKDKVELLDPIMGHLDETIVHVRNISHQMMPLILKKYGLKRAIEDLFLKMPTEDIVAKLIDWEDPKLDEEDSLILYRIIQELTNNTLKHSEASRIILSCQQQKNKITIRYGDNGQGFPANVLQKSDGMGLLNVKTRAQAIGAQTNFFNSKAGGAHVDLVIPTSID